MKKCTRCSVTKDLNEFNWHNKVKNIRRSECKVCFKLYYYKVKAFSEDERLKNILYLREYRKNLSDERKEYDRIKRKEKYDAMPIKWKPKIWTKEKIEHRKALCKIRYRKKIKEDPMFKTIHSLRARMNTAFRDFGGKRNKTIKLFGCNLRTAVSHIESQFKEGMSWDNHGLRGWHIDHIIPLTAAKSIGELEQLCVYTNLQPLWAKENQSKGNKIPNK